MALLAGNIVLPGQDHYTMGTSRRRCLKAYAIGTGLPILIFGVLMSARVARVSTWLNAVTRAERIIRVAVSTAFIGVGIYLAVRCMQA